MSHAFHADTIDDLRGALRSLGSLADRLRETREAYAAKLRDADATLASYEGRMKDLRHLLREADPQREADYAEPQAPAASERERVLGDFRALVEFWEQHPGVPVPDYHTVYINESDGVTAEAFDELAALLDATPVATRSGHRRAERKIGTLMFYASVKDPRPAAAPETAPLPAAAEGVSA